MSRLRHFFKLANILADVEDAESVLAKTADEVGKGARRHPADKEPKITYDADGKLTLYHGTSRKQADSIKVGGFRPHSSDEANEALREIGLDKEEIRQLSEKSQEKASVMFTKHLPEAEDFARAKADAVDDEPVVLVVRVTPQDVLDYNIQTSDKVGFAQAFSRVPQDLIVREIPVEKEEAPEKADSGDEISTSVPADEIGTEPPSAKKLAKQDAPLTEEETEEPKADEPEGEEDETDFATHDYQSSSSPIRKLASINEPYLLAFVERPQQKKEEKLEGDKETKNARSEIQRVLSQSKAVWYPIKTSKIKSKFPNLRNLKVAIIPNGKNAEATIIKVMNAYNAPYVWAYLRTQLKDGGDAPFDKLRYNKQVKIGPESGLNNVLNEQWQMYQLAKGTSEAFPVLQLNGTIPLSYGRFMSEAQTPVKFYVGGQTPDAGRAGMNYLVCNDDQYNLFVKSVRSFNPPPPFFTDIQFADLDPGFLKVEPKSIVPQNCVILTAKSKFLVGGGDEKFEDVVRAEIKDFLASIDQMNADMMKLANEIGDKVNADKDAEDIIPGYSLDKVANGFKSKDSSLDTLDILVGNNAEKFFKAAAPAFKDVLDDKNTKEYSELFPQWRSIRKQRNKPNIDNVIANLKASKTADEMAEKLTFVGFDERQAADLAKQAFEGNLDVLNNFALETLKNPKSKAGGYIKGELVMGSMVVHLSRDFTKALCWGGYEAISVSREEILKQLPFVKDADLTFAK